MNTVRLELLLLAGALGVGGYALSERGYAQEVASDYNHKVLFERFHTYSWGKDAHDECPLGITRTSRRRA